MDCWSAVSTVLDIFNKWVTEHWDSYFQVWHIVGHLTLILATHSFVRKTDLNYSGCQQITFILKIGGSVKHITIFHNLNDLSAHFIKLFAPIIILLHQISAGAKINFYKQDNWGEHFFNGTLLPNTANLICVWHLLQPYWLTRDSFCTPSTHITVPQNLSSQHITNVGKHSYCWINVTFWDCWLQ